MSTVTTQPTMWHKGVLLSMLVLDIVLAIAYTAVLGVLAQDGYETSQESTGGRAVILAVGPCVLLFDLVALALWARQCLTSKHMVVANSIKTLVWVVLLIANCLEGEHLYGHFLLVNVLQLLLILCAFAQLIYAAVILRRQSRNALPKVNGHVGPSGHGLEHDMDPSSSIGAGPVTYAPSAASRVPPMSKSTEAFEELRSNLHDEQHLPVYKASVAVARGMDVETKRPAPGYWSNV